MQHFTMGLQDYSFLGEMMYADKPIIQRDSEL